MSQKGPQSKGPRTTNVPTKRAPCQKGPWSKRPTSQKGNNVKGCINKPIILFGDKVLLWICCQLKLLLMHPLNLLTFLKSFDGIVACSVFSILLMTLTLSPFHGDLSVNSWVCHMQYGQECLHEEHNFFICVHVGITHT